MSSIKLYLKCPKILSLCSEFPMNSFATSLRFTESVMSLCTCSTTMRLFNLCWVIVLLTLQRALKDLSDVELVAGIIKMILSALHTWYSIGSLWCQILWVSRSGDYQETPFVHAESQSQRSPTVPTESVFENHFCWKNILHAILKKCSPLNKPSQGAAQGCDILHNQAVQNEL